ncbi:glycine oxidase [Rhodococcus triatomae]|uniref:glycine oxidase n=1 Tax=Rhodococcus triatomae TaxID=300028 RepID=A0A1G8NEF9_9NOCA|nr:glycine oxidase [Rhodococcus triatomae]
MSRSVAVVGGGVIGTAIAWQAARRGWRVRLHDPHFASGASWVAGGMLAPLSEGWPGEQDVLALGVASLDRWSDFGGTLESETGLELFTSSSSLTVALDSADAEDLRTIAEWVGEQGREMRVLNRAEVRELEPSLGRAVRLGLLAESERAVDNRLLVEALRRTAVTAGVEFADGPVHDLGALDADQVVLAAGTSSPKLWPGLPVRPVKGEILRLRTRPGATPPPGRTIRGTVHGRPSYLVPRADGIVVGATQYEAADTQVTVAGIRDLVADAEALMPAIGEYELHEATAGLRPATPDNLPLIGRLSEKVIVATGHGRNGILLTPVTADAVVALLEGSDLEDTRAADPGRFAGS